MVQVAIYYDGDGSFNCFFTQRKKDRVVPIVPDEARTFGLDSVSSVSMLLTVKNIPQKTINALPWSKWRSHATRRDAGAMSAWAALATSYSTNKWFQCICTTQCSVSNVLVMGSWRCASSRFLVGCNCWTLNGEGLQHQDGHSHILAFQTVYLMIHVLVMSWL